MVKIADGVRLPSNEVMLAIAILGLLEEDKLTVNEVLQKCKYITEELFHQGVGTNRKEG